MTAFEITNVLARAGFEPVGTRGYCCTCVRQSTGESLFLLPTVPMKRPGVQWGKVYVHDPGMLVASGDYGVLFSSLEPPNCSNDHGYPAWSDFPGEPHLTNVLAKINQYWNCRSP